MLPLRDDNPVRSTPWVMRTVILANTLAFVYELSYGARLRHLFDAGALVPVRVVHALGGGAPLAPALATILSSMFLHAGWLHLIGNMWYLWIFGDNVEDHFGHAGFALFYLAGGVASATLHIAFNAASSVPTVGASGAIAAVLGAYAVLFPGRRVVTLVPIFFFLQIMSLPALVVLGFWFVFQFFSGALSLGAGGGGVAWWAHVGGFVFGIAVTALVRPRRSRAWVSD
ncbi:MAG TPA: rhomboid family intramembrane serine protease [Candidatus Acidoferrales bacterium]|nr:rhomboid family intramembrane serine protease [Candidatus Acidoferrales bacterium]